MSLFDTHCHLADPDLFPERDEIIRRAKENGVNLILTVGYDSATNQRSIEIAEENDSVYCAVGVHPNEGEDLLDLPQGQKVVAIGETGLDYYRDQVDQRTQIERFLRHIEIARERTLPLIIHTRKAFSDIIPIVINEGYYRGVFHCYSGDLDTALKLTNLGFYISFSGSIIYGSRRLQKILRNIPDDRILIETDSPYISPFRGRKNEPANLKIIAEYVARILKRDFDEVARMVTENGKRLFKI